jgi:hypothetical protein
LSLIRDDDRRVVGIVVNAIDASLKGDSQQLSEWRVDTVRSLTDLLETASECGRHVLLASDHGHVPADRLQRHSTSYREHARWRPHLESRDAIQQGERAFRGPGVYQAKNTDGAVLLTTDTLRYGSAPHAGEHGGATLAEVVAPCLLLGWDEPIRERDSAELKLAPAFVPDWWHYATPSAALPPVVSTPPPPSRRKKPVSDQQLGLPPLGQKLLYFLRTSKVPAAFFLPKRKSSRRCSSPASGCNARRRNRYSADWRSRNFP